jgi:hypothetical protein
MPKNKVRLCDLENHVLRLPPTQTHRLYPPKSQSKYVHISKEFTVNLISLGDSLTEEESGGAAEKEATEESISILKTLRDHQF